MVNPLYLIKRTLHAVGKPLYHLRKAIPPEVEEIQVFLPRLPRSFEGYRLAVVADLHLPDSLSTPTQVLEAVSEAHPHCILLPGDIANRYSDFDAAGIRDFLSSLVAIAPCYAVTGNHEQNSSYLDAYCTLLKQCGITLLSDCWDTLAQNGETLPIYGACDREAPLPAAPTPSLLLMHYPEKAKNAGKTGFSLAVCGHAHGGQVRFGKRGLFSPGQGFFPRYISGLYRVNGIQMVVSRGLGDSSLPIRIHNDPHLPVICLHTEKV